MYLNVNLAANASNAGGESAAGSCTTPRTPEILNLLAGAPFDNLGSFGGVGGGAGGGAGGMRSSGQSFGSYFPSASSGLVPGTSGLVATGVASTPGDGPSSPGEHASSSFSSLSSLCSSPATPSTPPGNGPPSIQNTRTYLIKEGLKLTIQSKRMASGRGSLDADQLMHKPVKDELTTEDEERRRRRRERNKVAATKCRNRKKERTGILMKESDVLEDQNSNFRSEIQRLETEKRRLMDVLAMHSPNCLKTAAAANSQTPVSCSSDFTQTNVNINQPSHYTLANPVQTSGNFSQIYGCRSSSEGAAMAGLAPHHPAGAYDASGATPTTSLASEPCAGANYGDRSDMGFNQAGMMHRLSYGNSMADNHVGPNYR